MSEPSAIPSCDLSGRSLPLEPASLVVFGATGDLASRKIFPALYELSRKGLLPDGTRIVGFARRSLDEASFRESFRLACSRSSGGETFDESAWNALAPALRYCQGEIEDPSAYGRLAAILEGPNMPHSRLYYLAVSPEHFAAAARRLGEAGLGAVGPAAPRGGGSPGWRRLVVEKPFGYDQASSAALSAALHEAFGEDEVFRIDHYLGKEAVQNLLYFRFANAVFEPLWNRSQIERVEIDVLESEGIGSRGGYYDTAGAARDMLQNHLLQLLCLTAMESPSSLEPEAIRAEKSKVLRAVPDLRLDDYPTRSLRGQYGAGNAPGGAIVPDYRAEARVGRDSRTETFVALELEVQNWRWAGVPFVLRTGKALDRRVSEIRLVFRRPPEALFARLCGERLASNRLVLRIQPDEGMLLRFNAKLPGLQALAPSELRFSYRERGERALPEAYERLLADALAGDPTLFIAGGEAEEAWRIVDGLETFWKARPETPLLRYPAGSPPLELPRRAVGWR